MAAVTVYSSPIPEKSKTDAQEGNGRREEETTEGVAAMDKALVNEQELRTLLVERWKSLTIMGWKMFGYVQDEVVQIEGEAIEGEKKFSLLLSSPFTIFSRGNNPRRPLF